MPREEVGGRSYARVYRASGKADLHQALRSAVERSGGRVLYESPGSRAPVFFGVAVGDSERLGLLVYPFRAKGPPIRGRPADEHRAQIRYGAEESWGEDHVLGIDVAGVDITLVLAVHLDAGVFVGLDPLLYDPLPMGISVEFKDADVEATVAAGWHAWERVNRPGNRRGEARSESRVETLIGFTPDRLLDYARLEREATTLGLDPVLRRVAAEARQARSAEPVGRHLLEEAFHLSSQEILAIIAGRRRLQVAVRGGVAEQHLVDALSAELGTAAAIEAVDSDGPPDVIVTLASGQSIRVECKNGRVGAYRGGIGKVEVQKTRASKGDPASRFYSPDQFDVLAVCLWPDDGGRPTFVFRSSALLDRHETFPDRIAALHAIDGSWRTGLIEAVAKPMLGSEWRYNP